MKEQRKPREESDKKHSRECITSTEKWQPLILIRQWQTVAGDLDEVLSHSEQYLVCPICGEKLS